MEPGNHKPQSDPLPAAKEALKAGRFAEAERLAAEAGEDETEALYLVAVARRYAGRTGEAIDAARRLAALAPRYGRGHQELGHALRAAGDLPAALASYAEAVRFNPALKASWQMVGELAADPGAKEQAREQLRRLGAMPPELISVESMIAEGKLLKAERLCRSFLKVNKTHPEGMRLLARVGIETGVLDDAEFLLETAVAARPGDRHLRLDYVEVLRRRQKFARAMEEAEALRKDHPEDPAVLSAYANAALAIGRDAEALSVYSDLSSEFPGAAELHLARGHALKTTGEGEGAVDAYRRAAALRPGYGDAYWSLANLKTYRFDDDEIAAMASAEGAPATSPDDRIHLNFALGRAFEGRGDTEASFHHYRAGNALKKEQLRYDADVMGAEFEAQAEVFTEERLASFAGKGAPDSDPVFIVGLPRAGSTLLEQILTAHSAIDGTAELPNIPAIAHRLGGRRRRGEASLYPRALADLLAEELSALGRSYIEETRPLRAGAPLFTDKMPNNFRHIGLIRAILPNARIIDARRAPMDCCFSGFKQLFAEGQEFTYGLEEIGRYYRGYVRLMDHWDRVAPGAILRVQYEDVVADLEGQVRRILGYLGLPFEEACLDFHRSDRSVRTASAEQVRQPLYTSGVGQWRPFSPYLDPLRTALGPELCHE